MAARSGAVGRWAAVDGEPESGWQGLRAPPKARLARRALHRPARTRTSLRWPPLPGPGRLTRARPAPDPASSQGRAGWGRGAVAERAEPPAGLPGGIEGGGEDEHGVLGVGHGRRDEEELVHRERRGEGCDAAPLLGLPEIPNADILHPLRSD